MVESCKSWLLYDITVFPAFLIAGVANFLCPFQLENNGQELTEVSLPDGIVNYKGQFVHFIKKHVLDLLFKLTFLVLLFSFIFVFSYNLMLQCWHEEPSERPKFGSIASWMENRSSHQRYHEWHSYALLNPLKACLSVQQIEKLKRKDTSLIKQVTSVSRLQQSFVRKVSSKVRGQNFDSILMSRH